MTEHQIRKAAARLNGKRSWESRLKKQGKKAASAHMKALRSRRQVSKANAPTT